MPIGPFPTWILELERDPYAAVSELFAGRVDFGRFARLDYAEFLSRALAEPGVDPASRDRVDQGLSHWLEACQVNDAALRQSIGIQSHLYRLNEAFAAIVLLGLQRSARQLRDRHFVYRHWLSRYDYGYGDGPYAGYWRALAATQVDRRFQNQWHEFVVGAEERYPRYALHIGVTGIRGLDLPSDERILRLLNALLRRAWRIGTEAAAAEFGNRLGGVAADVPMANDGWRGRVLRLLEGLREEELAHRHPVFRVDAFQNLIANALQPWIGDIALSRATAQSVAVPRLPEANERLNIAQQLSARRPDAVRQALELLARHRAYAEASGDAYFFVRTLCNLGHRILQLSNVDAPTVGALQSLLRSALVWEPSNPYPWSFWAELELTAGREDVAETVLWEAARRFPENEPCRVELALLLQRRYEREQTPALLAEAEQLLREAIEASPGHEPSQVELARLLARRHQREHAPDLLVEAEQLLRQVVGANPLNVHSRSELARLLATSERVPEARELLVRWLIERENSVWRRMLESLDRGERLHLPSVDLRSSKGGVGYSQHAWEDELLSLRANAAATRFAYACERGGVIELAAGGDLARFYRGWFGVEQPVIEEDGVRPPFALVALAALSNPSNWERLKRDYPGNANDTRLLKVYSGIAIPDDERAELMAWLGPSMQPIASKVHARGPNVGSEVDELTAAIADGEATYEEFLCRRLHETGLLASHSRRAPATADRSGDIDRLIEKHLARSIDANIPPVPLAA